MEYLVPILAVIFIFSPKLVREIKDYLLKKEQIKADTELKAEALRLKNSLELEKFIGNSNSGTAHNPNIDSNLNDDSYDRIKRKGNSEY